MELNPKELAIDAIIVTTEMAKFVGERLVGGAFAQLANMLIPENEDHIIRGEE